MTSQFRGPYALMSYHTINIGDDIQSLAARAYLPSVSRYVDRESIAEFKSSMDDETTRMIGNGWYAETAEAWPPTDDLDLLPVSIHVSRDSFVRKAFVSSRSRDYLSSHGPVGARDTPTLRFFESAGIEAYLSQCLTLTLQPCKELARQDYVVLVEPTKELEKFVRAATSRPVVVLSIYVPRTLPTELRLRYAELVLGVLQSASAVVTGRLHSLLPSVAFGTPVAYVPKVRTFDARRLLEFRGLSTSFTSVREFVEESATRFPLDAPLRSLVPRSSDTVALQQRVEEFTGRRVLPYISSPTRDFVSLLSNVEAIQAIFRLLATSSMYESDYAGHSRVLNGVKNEIRSAMGRLDDPTRSPVHIKARE